MSETISDQPLPPVDAPPARSPRRVSGLVAAALLLAVVSYVAGARSSHASVAVRHGTAVITPDQIGVNSGGVSYAIPLDVPWKDAEGGWHEGDRPSCLPATLTSARVTFGAVKYALEGTGGYVVVWVDCSR